MNQEQTVSENKTQENSILEVSHLEKSFGSHSVLKDISFSVHPGDVVSVQAVDVVLADRHVFDGGATGIGGGVYIREYQITERCIVTVAHQHVFARGGKAFDRGFGAGECPAGRGIA